MTTTTTRRIIPLSLLMAALALASPSKAQDPQPSPSQKPAASPAPVVDERPVVVDEPAVQVDTEQVSVDVERATREAVREAELSMRAVETNRAAMERDVRRAVEKSVSKSGKVRTKAALEAEIAVQVAAREARTVHAWRGEHDEAVREAMQEAREAAREKEQEIREQAREAEQQAREAVQEDREAQREKEQDAREAAEDAAREARESAIEAQQTQTEKDKEARERAREKEQAMRDRARERDQELRERAREKEQEQRDREQERRDREQERRDGEREKSDQIDELYDQAMESIDDEEWSNALRSLNKLMTLNARIDAALYWTSYVQGRTNRAAASLETLARLQKDFPASRWAREGKALELEVRGKSGQTPRPDQEEDLDLKLMAVSALAQSDPQEALPILSKILSSPSSPRKIRERSLFVLAQMGSDQAGNAIAEVARGNSAPELQRKAIQYLGVFGGPGNRKVLSEIYTSSTDNIIRKQILNSFMVSGDKARVLTAAKTEKDPALRTDAIRLLGVMGGTAELSQMYSTATTAEEKKDILHALFIGGAIEPVAAAARNEKDKDVRLAAVRSLGLMGRKSQDVLGEMYRAETDPQVKKEILNAFFLQANATKLIEVARIEKDPGLKKDAVHWLSLMNSKESRAYMIELLKD